MSALNPVKHLTAVNTTALVSQEAMQGSVDIPALSNAILADIRSHLQTEFDANRLRGADYAKVYLGSMEAVLTNSVQYLVASALLDVQRRKVEEEILQTRLENERIKLETQKVALEMDVVRLQAQKLQLEIDMAPITKDRMQAEAELAREQVTKIRYEVNALMPAQLDKFVLDLDKTRAEIRYQDTQTIVLGAQMDKLKADTDMVIQQTALLPLQADKLANEVRVTDLTAKELEYKISDLLPLQKAQLELARDKLAADVSEVNSRIPLIQAQVKQILDTLAAAIAKANAEAALMQARAANEALQPGLIAAQIALLQQQKEGFIRDAEYKISKLMSDAYAVQRNGDETLAPPIGLTDNEIRDVLFRALNGIGVIR